MPRLWYARGLSCAALFPGFLRRDLSLSSDKSHREKWGVLGEIELRDREEEMERWCGMEGDRYNTSEEGKGGLGG